MSVKQNNKLKRITIMAKEFFDWECMMDGINNWLENTARQSGKTYMEDSWHVPGVRGAFLTVTYEAAENNIPEEVFLQIMDVDGCDVFENYGFDINLPGGWDEAIASIDRWHEWAVAREEGEAWALDYADYDEFSQARSDEEE